ncbi:hypothetical protein C2S52_014966 [Perilla frutescens var. hirtella]|nr:hypothetical protein C2S52_014966 [Perilla frutescens var. hirtella]
MAEGAVTSIVGAVIDAVVKDVVAVVKRQFNYLCCFSRNISSLKKEAKTLEDATGEVEVQVEREKENAQDIVPAVETWLTDSNDFKGIVNGILNEVPNVVESGCLRRLSARYSVSRKAMKTAEAIKEHREHLKDFDHISHPKPPAATVPIPSAGATYEFESRKQIEENVMTSLKLGDDLMMGICGMGGLGKTTLANKIHNRALEEHVFEEVVMVVVSQQVDKYKIQLQIAEQLRLELVEETSYARANRLRERLNDAKRTLLILDDVWKSLNLVELGIPCGSERCRILITSRNRDALSGIDVGKIFGMEILSEEEAWLLFRVKAGTCVDDAKLTCIAQQVVKECRGLPIALATVGAALKDDKDERIWNDALKQLRKGNPKNIPEFIAQVYNPLEVSYSKLESEEAKSLFLLCCLFHEDVDIPVNHLTCFCIGLHILEDVRILEEARNRTYTLIKMLKSRSLLLDSEREDCVRMHDVVRDVCIFIAKQKGYIGGNDCTWISSSFERLISMGLVFPNLHLLSLTANRFSMDEEIQINNINSFLEGVRDLYVLSIELQSWSSLPHTTRSLKNLGTLMLDSCWDLKRISVVGDLANLEILICRNCGSIKELPLEIGRLNRLKLLELTRCHQLQRIGRGIISSLVGLEELKMLESLDKWEAWDIQGENAAVRELESLTKLTCLEIEIADPALAAENMRLSSKIERFEIKIPALHEEFRELGEYNKILHLHWVDGACLGYWIHMQLLRDTQCLVLTGDGVNDLDQQAEFPNNYSMQFQSDFQRLVLTRDYLPKFQNNYAPVFTNLSSIDFTSCPRLHNLCRLSISGKDCLPLLEFLSIVNCEVMEQVFFWNHEENKNNGEARNPRHITKMFPKLKKVKLEDMPNLITFCQGIEGIEFPQLVKMHIFECPKMTSFISNTCLNGVGSSSSGSTSSEDADYDHSSHLYCQTEKVSFGSNLKKLNISVVGENLFRRQKIHLSSFNGLEELFISKYEGRMSLFTSSVAGSLVSLVKLVICDCDEMVRVIQDEEEEEEAGDRIVLPNFLEVWLVNLLKLVTFCESKCDVELPSLRKMDIKGCPSMANFTSGRLTAPNFIDLQADFNHSLDVLSSSLKRLTITGIENSLCHYKIDHVSFLNGLDELRIYNYQGIKNLFSSSIAGNLLVSGGERSPLFPSIAQCPEMTSFTLGALTTPNLAKVILDYDNKFGATDLQDLDLNGLLKHHFGRPKQKWRFDQRGPRESRKDEEKGRNTTASSNATREREFPGSRLNPVSKSTSKRDQNVALATHTRDIHLTFQSFRDPISFSRTRPPHVTYPWSWSRLDPLQHATCKHDLMGLRLTAWQNAARKRDLRGGRVLRKGIPLLLHLTVKLNY